MNSANKIIKMNNNEKKQKINGKIYKQAQILKKMQYNIMTIIMMYLNLESNHNKIILNKMNSSQKKSNNKHNRNR